MRTNDYQPHKCFRFCVYFYLGLNVLVGFLIASFATYLFIFRQGTRFSTSRFLIIFMLTYTALFTVISTLWGWFAVTKKNIKSLRFLAVILGIGALIEIAGALYTFVYLPKINSDVSTIMEHSFHSLIHHNSENQHWWNSIQERLKCCGINGPTDYKGLDGVPFSCCGTDYRDDSKGNCTYIFQKGCTMVLTDEVTYDSIYLSLASLGFAFLHIPGAVLYWYYGTLLCKEMAL